MQILKLNIEHPDAHHSNRLDIKEASFNVTNAIVEFLYTGMVDTAILEQRGLDLLSAAHKVSVLIFVSFQLVFVGTCKSFIRLAYISFEITCTRLG